MKREKEKINKYAKMIDKLIYCMETAEWQAAIYDFMA